eukprot:scaffold21017_cov104-Isochrysis_galbana.AAC.1
MCLVPIFISSSCEQGRVRAGDKLQRAPVGRLDAPVVDARHVYEAHRSGAQTWREEIPETIASSGTSGGEADEAAVLAVDCAPAAATGSDPAPALPAWTAAVAAAATP